LVAYKKSIVPLALTVLIVVFVFPHTFSTSQAQTLTVFTPIDKFTDPTQNSTITFALNGTCTSVTLENGTWTFRDLRFDDPRLPYFDLSGINSVGNLSFAARDCNVTIWVYLNAVYSYPVAIVSYLAKGSGTQTVNLGLNTSPTGIGEWSVVDENGVFMAEGQGWALLPDDSLLVTPTAPGNVTVMHFDFNDPETQKFLPIWMQHSIFLLTGAVLCATVVLTVLLKIKRDRKAHIG
jgi:hypothetical protein